jgi:hypothetical protein
MPANLPLVLAFAYCNAPLQVARHGLQMADQLGLLGANPLGNTMEANVMLRPLRDRREGMRVNPELAPPARNSANARGLLL